MLFCLKQSELSWNHVDLCESNSIIMEMFVKFYSIFFFFVQHNKMNSISAFDGSAFLTNNWIISVTTLLLLILSFMWILCCFCCCLIFLVSIYLFNNQEISAFDIFISIVQFICSRVLFELHFFGMLNIKCKILFPVKLPSFFPHSSFAASSQWYRHLLFNL